MPDTVWSLAPSVRSRNRSGGPCKEVIPRRNGDHCSYLWKSARLLGPPESRGNRKEPNYFLLADHPSGTADCMLNSAATRQQA
jgi:hypothetical protein